MSKINKNQFDTVIFVAGITHFRTSSAKWRKVLGSEFPEKELVFIDDSFYIHTQEEMVKSLIQRIHWKLREGSKTLIIAHSFGGILAKAAISKIEPDERQNIIGFMALASPHSMKYGQIKEVKERFDIPECLLNVDTYTFGGLFDPIVPCPFTRVDNSIFHKNINSEHMMFVLSERVINKVLHSVVDFNEGEE